MRSMRAALTLCLLLSAAPVGAWAPQGHRTVGAIADRLLTPAAQAAVARLLAGDLDKFGNPSGRTTLEAVSVWADELNGTAAARPAWHYDDAPVCGSEPKAQYCPDGQCNSAQLVRLAAVLADPRAAPRARNEALKWVVHLVGDLHQPLHAANNNDRGGNQVQVVLAGVRPRGRQNLHRVWDNELVTLALQTRGRQQPPRDIDALAGAARRMAAEVGQRSPDSGARESNNLARNLAYHYPGFVCDRVPPGVVVLDAEYQASAELVVRERLQLAGARLATLLNQTLSAGH
jgi:S1/P1 Nuclease